MIKTASALLRGPRGSCSAAASRARCRHQEHARRGRAQRARRLVCASNSFCFSYLVNGCLNLQQVVVEGAPETLCTACEDRQCHDCQEGRFIGHMTNLATVSATFEVLCSRAVLRGYLGSIFFFAFGIGSYCGGLISDSLERTRSMYVTDALMCVGSLSFLASNYNAYVMLRFIAGLGDGAGIE